MKKYLAIAAAAVLLGVAAAPASAAEFKIAVEAPPGLQMVAFVLDNEDANKANLVYENPEPIHQRFLDRFYVIDIPYELGEIVQLCVTDVTIRDASKWNPECVIQDTMKFLPGNDPPVVHFVYEPAKS